MRQSLFSALALAIAVVPLATAQTAGDCGDAASVWLVDVDDSGFVLMDAAYDFTAGDDLELQVSNDDPDDAHTISLSGHDVSITVPPDGLSEPHCIHLDQAGTFTLKDMPSGDTLAVHVVGDDTLGGSDTLDDAATDPANSSDVPGPGAAVLAVAVAALAAIRRRR